MCILCVAGYYGIHDKWNQIFIGIYIVRWTWSAIYSGMSCYSDVITGQTITLAPLAWRFVLICGIWFHVVSTKFSFCLLHDASETCFILLTADSRGIPTDLKFLCDTRQTMCSGIIWEDPWLRSSVIFCPVQILSLSIPSLTPDSHNSRFQISSLQSSH